MRNRYLPLLSTIALLTAAASVGQPQTVDPSTGMATTPSNTQSSTTSGQTQSGTSGTTGTYGTSGTTDTTGSATNTSSGTPGVLGGTGASASLQGQDATFLQRALEMGRMEVAQAQAALSAAERNDTKVAARTLLEDHQRSNQQLQQLVSRKGWSMPAASESAESDQARMASGAGNFDDDRFMTEQIRMHRDAISLYRAQASSGSDPDLRQFASDQLPHLEHHLEMLQGENTQK